MKQTGKHRVIVINLLVALALTLIVNFSFLLNGNDVRGHRPPPMMTMAPGFIAFQLFYFYAMAIAIVVLNTVRSLSLTRKILLTIAITVLFYLFIPTLSRGGNWNIPLMTGRLYNPLHIMKNSTSRSKTSSSKTKTCKRATTCWPTRSARTSCSTR